MAREAEAREGTVTRPTQVAVASQPTQVASQQRFVQAGPDGCRQWTEDYVRDADVVAERHAFNMRGFAACARHSPTLQEALNPDLMNNLRAAVNREHAAGDPEPETLREPAQTWGTLPEGNWEDWQRFFREPVDFTQPPTQLQAVADSWRDVAEAVRDEAEVVPSPEAEPTPERSNSNSTRGAAETVQVREMGLPVASRTRNPLHGRWANANNPMVEMVRMAGTGTPDDPFRVRTTPTDSPTRDATRGGRSIGTSPASSCTPQSRVQTPPTVLCLPISRLSLEAGAPWY